LNKEHYVKEISEIFFEMLIGFAAAFAYCSIAYIVIWLGQTVPVRSPAYISIGCIVLALLILANAARLEDATKLMRVRQMVTCGVTFFIVMANFSPL
jgi:hypothetical protein